MSLEIKVEVGRGRYATTVAQPTATPEGCSAREGEAIAFYIAAEVAASRQRDDQWAIIAQRGYCELELHSGSEAEVARAMDALRIAAQRAQAWAMLVFR